MKYYKLFEMVNGKLYPLFIESKKAVPIGEWVPAEIGDTKGKFALRPGWHIGEIPDAPWLKGYDGSDKGIYKSKRGKNGKRVWAEVEFTNSIDYQSEVDNLPGKCFKNRIPENGFYHFRETGGRPWIISGAIRVVKVLSEDERQQVLEAMGYDEIAAYASKKAAFEKKMGKSGGSAVRS